MSDFWETGLVLRTLTGSRAHGLARPDSDTDTRGVCIPPARFLIGLSEFEQHETDGGDHVTYALAKFVRLALGGNPNILESLFTDEQDVLFVNDDGRELLDARERFLSKQVAERFLGYAEAQLKRLERHHRWLADPPQGAPDPADFGGRQEGGRVRFPGRDEQRAFDAALKHWNHYRTWRAERNPKRAALEEAYGYDTKHGMHLVRLLRMAEEIITRGEVLVRRPDAEDLRAIREGSLEYAALRELAEATRERVVAAVPGSPLPDEPDRDAAEALVIELHRRALSRG